ncbi:MAG: alanine--tRNA ligase [Bacteroidales bacterium]
MNSGELRQKFLDFFRTKGHIIVPSSSMVIKNDPTLMFTNAGMNQFKDIFLGNQQAIYKRVANSQKCLRVSGKHNDLEEVGHDTYHHTMFEMLGNWSFGDYFKKEAIEWAWEFLVKVLGISEERLYATVFEGSPKENVPRDEESYMHWKKCFKNEENRVLEGSRKDNFWEMGDTGPCGPCSEIHVDLRTERERSQKPGHLLINKGDPLVIEIWNLVFIQYNRKADGTLELLPSKNVDTGMGFERLCMVVQSKKSNYDTDIFQSLINEISSITGKKYGINDRHDIAMRVVADHLRAVSFSIADGQLPSNNKAGYVIRRILRRAVRYSYTYLGMEEPFIYRLTDILAEIMGDPFPELAKNKNLISKVIREEESAFLKTLGKGLKLIEKRIAVLINSGKDIFPGNEAFELYDTYGFPVDLTRLILRENHLKLDMEGFENAMKGQKKRSREDASTDTGDWVIVRESNSTEFTGYEKTEDEVLITRYRKIKVKGRERFHLVFNKTPFYAESGGQAGDSGELICGNEKIHVTDTFKENNLIIHTTDRLPSDPSIACRASVYTLKRMMTANNHSATHLLHLALREILGQHVEQKGSLVTWERLRFDFSHYTKMTTEEILKVEKLVNQYIRKNIDQVVYNDIPFEEARKMGAIALFGEKYGERVRVIKFGDSVELCGGIHVHNTGTIGIFKIISESAISAGVRRIEAVTGEKAEEYIISRIKEADEVAELLRSTGNIAENVRKLISENTTLRRSIEKMLVQLASINRKSLEEKISKINGIRFIKGIVETESPELIKTIAQQLRNSYNDLVFVAGSVSHNKAHLLVLVSDRLVRDRNISAVEIIKNISPAIEGGGGGQPFMATAGGKKISGLQDALDTAEKWLKNKILPPAL